MLFATALTSSQTNAYIFQWKLNVAYEEEGDRQTEHQETLCYGKTFVKHLLPAIIQWADHVLTELQP